MPLTELCLAGEGTELPHGGRCRPSSGAAASAVVFSDGVSASGARGYPDQYQFFIK